MARKKNKAITANSAPPVKKVTDGQLMRMDANTRDLLYNTMMARKDWLTKLFDPRRDYNKECGHPDVITAQDYRAQFDRNPIARRTVEVYPFECWKSTPDVYEDEDPDVETPFEQAWREVGSMLNGASSYEDQKGHPIWEYLRRIDVLSGIGSYGVLLIGIDDGKPLSEPIEGVEEYIYKELMGKGTSSQGAMGTDAQYGIGFQITQNAEDNLPKDVQGPRPGASKLPPKGKESLTDKPSAEDDVEKKPVATKHKLLYLRCFDESIADVSTLENNQSHPRFGQPLMYNLTFNDPVRQPDTPAVGVTMTQKQVHWTRVIHIADGCGSSEWIGTPRMEPVYNRLLDLIKLYGGSAEMYWQGAFPGYSIETIPQLGGDVIFDPVAIRGQMENYMNSLQRWIGSAGMQVKSLAPQVSDPTPQIDAHITAICIQKACPKRIFMGSERGELASSQDKDTWADRVEERCVNYLTPKMIRLVVDRFIAIGVLPVPKQFSVKWPDMEKLSKTEEAAIALQMTQALSTYISTGVDALMAPLNYLVDVCGFEEKQAQQFLDAVADHLEEVAPETDENIVPGHTPKPPEPELPMMGPNGKPIPPGNGGPPQQKGKPFGGGGGKPPIGNFKNRLTFAFNGRGPKPRETSPNGVHKVPGQATQEAMFAYKLQLRKRSVEFLQAEYDEARRAGDWRVPHVWEELRTRGVSV